MAAQAEVASLKAEMTADKVPPALETSGFRRESNDTDGQVQLTRVQARNTELEERDEGMLATLITSFSFCMSRREADSDQLRVRSHELEEELVTDQDSFLLLFASVLLWHCGLLSESPRPRCLKHPRRQREGCKSRRARLGRGAGRRYQHRARRKTREFVRVATPPVLVHTADRRPAEPVRDAPGQVL